MAPSRYVIRNAHVMTQDPELGDISGGDVLIEGSRIAAVRADLGPVDAVEIDGTDKLALPGFVDTHRHTWQALIRHLSTDWTLAQYFSGVRGVLGRNYEPEDMYAANLAGALDALDSGITTLVDWSHNNNTPEHADAAVKALLDAGIRAVFAYGNSNDEWLPVSDVPLSRDVARVRERWFSGDGGLVTLAVAARGPQFATPEATEQDFALAAELDLPVTVHVGDGLWGLNGPVRWLHERGLATPRTTYVHTNTISDEEYRIVADTGGAVSIAPELEMHMGHGRLATLRAMRHGVPVSISIDVCTSVGGDMFSAMRALLAGTRYLVNLEALEERQGVDVLPVMSRDVLGFATREGARAAWLGAATGTLTPGKQADVVLLDTQTFGWLPLNYPAGAVIESGHPGLVDTVFVAGRIVKRHGRLVDFDLRRVRRLAEDARDRVLSRCGVTDPGTWLPKPYEAG